MKKPVCILFLLSALLASAAYGLNTGCENLSKQSGSRKPIRLKGEVRVLEHSGVLLVDHSCNLSYRLAWNTEQSFNSGGILQDKKFKAFEKYLSSENKLDGKVIHMNYHEVEIGFMDVEGQLDNSGNSTEPVFLIRRILKIRAHRKPQAAIE